MLHDVKTFQYLLHAIHFVKCIPNDVRRAPGSAFSLRVAHFGRARAAQRTGVEVALVAEVRNRRRKNAKKERLEKGPLFRKSVREVS
jgi:hypothetical protein